jgi:hypothetical protein
MRAASLVAELLSPSTSSMGAGVKHQLPDFPRYRQNSASPLTIYWTVHILGTLEAFVNSILEALSLTLLLLYLFLLAQHLSLFINVSLWHPFHIKIFAQLGSIPDIVCVTSILHLKTLHCKTALPLDNHIPFPQESMYQDCTSLYGTFM